MFRTPGLLAATGSLLAAAALAAPAAAAPIAVTDGVTNWQTPRNYAPSTARTYLGYVLNSGDPMRGASNGTITAGFGAEIIKPGGARIASATHTDIPGPSPTAQWTFEFDVTSGTVDVATREANVSATGSINFNGHSGAMDTTIENLRIKLGADGTGGVYAGGTYLQGGGPPPAPAATPAPIDYTRPIFTLDAKQATFAQAASGQVTISGLAPTMGPVAYFGASYPSGIAGPDRTPNTFGSFGLVVNTVPLAVIEQPIDRIVEKPVAVEKTVTVEQKTVRIATTLDDRPFSKSAVEVEIRKAGSKQVIGEGYVISRKLRVFVPEGTKLNGKYVLDRTSGSKKLKKKSFFAIGAKAKQSKKSGR